MASYSNNTSNELTATSNASYSYDLNGNAATKNNSAGITAYAWDFENRLTSVTLPASGGTVSFKYDPFGRRIYKSSSTATNVYAYDGDNLIEETNGSGAVIARYSEGLRADEPLAMLRAGATSYYQADGLGSISSLSSVSGSLVQLYTFDSFGKQVSASGSLTNSFQFTSREADSETGLYYYRARYYDPATGKFLSEDPISFRGGSVNLYTYTRNSPPNFADPHGNTPAVATIPILLGEGVGVAAVGTGVAVVGLTGLAVYDGILVARLIDAEVKSCDWCLRFLHPRPKTAAPPATAKPLPICNKPAFPGFDPTKAPGKDWEWRGKPPVGGPKGGWYNPDTGESLHPDLAHPDPIPPHWDYIDPSGNGWRLFPDGTATPK